MQISFYGAAQTVTGSKHLITLDNGKRILLDCGLYQGMGKEGEELNRHFGFDPHSVDIVILSHAHIDHSGLLPKLVKDGFKGKIYCTEATLEICEILLKDSAKIQEDDMKHINKKRNSESKKKAEPLYDSEDVPPCLDRFVSLPEGKEIELMEGVKLKFTFNGHILGSAAITLYVDENGKQTSLTFTGDIGKYGSGLIIDPLPFPQSDYIICESTYGNRLHESSKDSESLILNTVIETCVKKKGKLIIPAFSLGRTQEIVFTLNNLELQGKLPKIKVFVDSPLSFSATNITRKYVDELNEKVRHVAKTDPDPFGFDRLTYITDRDQSQALNDLKEPCIIISASGMATAGRVKHHIMHNIDNENNTILIVGYAEPNSLAGKLRNGDEEVRIFGDPYLVKAQVKIMDSYSAHGDYSEMIRYLSCQDKEKVKKIFLVHGSSESISEFAKKLKVEGYKEIIEPNRKDSFVLS
jgi:metallo-beta-lactamase family protein